MARHVGTIALVHSGGEDLLLIGCDRDEADQVSSLISPWSKSKTSDHDSTHTDPLNFDDSDHFVDDSAHSNDSDHTKSTVPSQSITLQVSQ